jgi:hypothetical protein
MWEVAEAGLRDERRRLLLKRALEVVGWLVALALLAFAGRAVLAAAPAPAEKAAAVVLRHHTPAPPRLRELEEARPGNKPLVEVQGPRRETFDRER